MNNCEISENINKIISELKKINDKCEDKKVKIIVVEKDSNNEKVEKANKQTSTNERIDEEVRAGYMGPQTNTSNNNWITSLRNPFSFYMS